MFLERNNFLRAILAVALLSACSSEGEAPSESDDDADDDTAQEEEPSKSDDDDDESEPTTVKRDAGKGSSPSSMKDASAPRPSPDGGKAMAPPAGESGIPCEVATIVSKYCAECHGDEPIFGAPFSLTSIAHFQADAPDDDGKKIHELAHDAVNATDKTRMPPPSKPAIPEADLKKLSDWLAGGAKTSDELCKVEFPSEPEGDGDTEFATPGSGGAHTKPIDYQDPEMKCYPFVAFAKNDRKGKYTVPTNPDYYVAFYMKAPWTGTQYIRAFKGIIDNKDVIHHWLFFKNLTPATDGRVQENALGAHPDGEMLFGWAPGGDDMYMDPDVGMAVSGNDTFLLEAHYNSKTAGAKDASGVEVCVTPKKPAHLAALTWVGTSTFAATTSATGQCNSTHKEPVRIFAAQPHMHVKGKHMKVVVNRKNGMKETIHDEPFSFEYQRSYTLDVTLQPGDTLTTTCTFSSPASFGKGTNDEMCYFFANSWPAGALAAPGIGTILHGPNSCL